MRDDFDMIVWKLEEDYPIANIYPIGDLHIGSPEFNVKKFMKWRDMVADDPYGRVVILGDMIDNGLRNSKTNVYMATMNPMEQKWELARLLMPIKEKIIGAVSGNHEYRTTRETGDCPLYDVMVKLDLEEYYRPNMAFIKINVGRRNAERQWSYALVATHGQSANKTKKFVPYIDGMDIFLSGHIHNSGSSFPAKIVMDTKNNVVTQVPVIPVVVPSFADYGGYAIRGLYEPSSNVLVPVIHLSGEKKEVTLSWI